MSDTCYAATRPSWRRRHPVLFWLGLIFLIWLVFSIIMGAYGATQPGGALSGPYIGVVNIEGAIEEHKPIVEWIERLRKDENAVGILVRIDSPGGAVTPSEEIYTALKRLGESRPMVASLGATAASGGYMAALPADVIVANPTTITGSIGVLMELGNYRELMDKLGVTYESLSTGELKTAGAPYQQLTDKEREYFMGIIQDMFGRFAEMVRSHREMSDEQFARLMDGRVVTGRRAEALGLVDRLGDSVDAMGILQKMVDAAEVLPVLEGPEEEDYSMLRALLSKAGLGETAKLLERVVGQVNAPRGVRFYYF